MTIGSDGPTGLRQPNVRSFGMPYRKTTGLLTKGERAFWYPLFAAVDGRYSLFCKVRLSDVICCPDESRNERHWFRLIGHYHVDFVLCDPATTAPLLVIELDDRSHQDHRQTKRDDFKDKALKAAGLPVHRVPARRAYDPLELVIAIERLIAASLEPPAN